MQLAGLAYTQLFLGFEDNQRKIENLREVVLKSIEILEIETKLEAIA